MYDMMQFDFKCGEKYYIKIIFSEGWSGAWTKSKFYFLSLGK